MSTWRIRKSLWWAIDLHWSLKTKGDSEMWFSNTVPKTWRLPIASIFQIPEEPAVTHSSQGWGRVDPTSHNLRGFRILPVNLKISKVAMVVELQWACGRLVTFQFKLLSSPFSLSAQDGLCFPLHGDFCHLLYGLSLPLFSPSLIISPGSAMVCA